MSSDVERLIMCFNLMGDGTKTRVIQHPGKVCGPCVVCSYSSNRFFHPKNREDNEALQRNFQQLPCIAINDCICKPCETNFRYKFMAKHIQFDHIIASSTVLCD